MNLSQGNKNKPPLKRSVECPTSPTAAGLVNSEAAHCISVRVNTRVRYVLNHKKCACRRKRRFFLGKEPVFKYGTSHESLSGTNAMVSMWSGSLKANCVQIYLVIRRVRTYKKMADFQKSKFRLIKL